MLLRDIGEKLGFSYMELRGFIAQYNRKQRKLAAGIPPRPKGRPRTAEAREPSIAEYTYKIERLKMENELLQEFLRSTGRK